MEEIREVIRHWRAGRGRKPIAGLVGLDPKTVRSCIRSAEACGIVRDGADPSEERWTAPEFVNQHWPHLDHQIWPRRWGQI